MEFGKTYVSPTKLGFIPFSTAPGHFECNSALAISRAGSSLLVLGGKVLKVGVAGSIVVWRFVAKFWYRGFATPPADEMSVGKPTGEMIEHSSADD